MNFYLHESKFWWKVMKITFSQFLIIIFMTGISYAKSANAQGILDQKINLSADQQTLKDILKILAKTNKVQLVFNQKIIQNKHKITINVKDTPLKDVLNKLLDKYSIGYRVFKEKVILYPKEGAENLQTPFSLDLNEQTVISGKVTDETDGPLPGVTVKIKGTGKVTQTDKDGKYTINTPGDNVTLVFSYLGYNDQEIAANGRSRIDIRLKANSNSLNEVVVVGYGTQKKVNLTGAVSSVSGDDLLRRHVVNPATSLQGTIPGLRIVQGSGQPGAEGVGIEIRGYGTYSGAGSGPLILIDGVPGDLNGVDPANIKSVSVLKDAASASIYGSRGANGVILVTTKDGSEGNGKFMVSYNLNYGLVSPTKLPDLVTNSVQYARLFNQAKTNSGITASNQFYPDSVISLYQNPSDPIKYPNADWTSIMFQTAPTVINNLTFSGGDKTTYNISLSYADQNGVMKAFDYKKYNGRVNLSSKISTKLKAGVNLGFKNSNQSEPRNGAQDAFYQTIAHPPTALPYLPDGSGRYTYRAYPWEAVRPNQFAADNQLSNYNNYNINTQIWADLEIFKDLHWYTKGAANAFFNRGKTFSSTVTVYDYLNPENQGLSSNIPGNGLTQSMDETVYKNVFSYLRYTKTIGQSNVSIQGGYSLEKQDYYYLQGDRPDFSNSSTPELNAGNADPQFNNGYSNAWAISSFFGRANYDYRGKYLLEANLRYDGSSRLSPKSRWGLFPSFSGGWRITQENFMQGITSKGWLNDLKIRGSWGQLGNQNIGLYPYQALINIGANYPFGGSLTTGAYQSALNNENITWETTTMTNIGIDAVLFKRLNITIDAYKKYTKDILRNAQVTGLVGLSAPVINDGAMSNTGLELALSYNNSIKSGSLKGFNFNAGFNISGFRNRVEKFGSRQDNGATIIEEGKPWNTFYLLQWDGIFQSKEEVAASPKQFGENTVPGDLKFKDVNGDGIVNNDDRVPMTNGVFPKLNYGLNFDASFKGFDLAVFLQGVSGQKGIFGYGTAPGLTPFFAGIPPSRIAAEESWTSENHSNTMPKLYFSDFSGSEKVWKHPSTFLLYNMSYLRFKTLQLGYSLPKKITDKLAMSNFRLYVSGDNLFTVTNFPGLDPEKPGGSYLSYPQNKTLSFGLSANF